MQRAEPIAVAAMVLMTIAASSTSTQASDTQTTYRAWLMARAGRCDKATAALESAAATTMRPRYGDALAKCYVNSGKLLLALGLYDAIAAQKPSRHWDQYDRNAHSAARRDAKRVAARLGTLVIHLRGELTGVSMTVDDEPIEPGAAWKLDPGVEVSVSVRADSHEPYQAFVVVAEGEHHVLDVQLSPTQSKAPHPSSASAADVPTPVRGHQLDPGTSWWLGARGRAFVVPQPFLNAFVDGGRTLVAPGAAVSLIREADTLRLAMSLAYASYRFDKLIVKPIGAPDSDFEILDSDLMSLAATLELSWSVALSEDVRFNLGVALGVGWLFYGDVIRTQAYPDESTGTYERCNAPNDPSGSYRHCNTLDHDRDHYGHAEESWLDGGSVPTVHPWGALPNLGLSWRPTETMSFDLEAALTVTGVMAGLGVHHAL